MISAVRPRGPGPRTGSGWGSGSGSTSGKGVGTGSTGSGAAASASSVLNVPPRDVWGRKSDDASAAGRQTLLLALHQRCQQRVGELARPGDADLVLDIPHVADADEFAVVVAAGRVE